MSPFPTASAVSPTRDDRIRIPAFGRRAVLPCCLHEKEERTLYDFNRAVIDEFRANRGRVGGMFTDARLILLTTTGARTGRPHTVPLAHLPDESGRILVVASAAGAPLHPAWFHNLRANPEVTVETGDRRRGSGMG